MRLLVCGGRDFADRAMVDSWLDFLHYQVQIDVLIHGNASGADSLAAQWAERHQVKVEPFPADWERHGRAAGPIRNERMIRYGKPDLVLAFPGGRGTANMIDNAHAAGISVTEANEIIPTPAG